MTQTVLLGDLIHVVKGISYRSSDYTAVGEGMPFVNLKCVGRGDGFRRDGLKYYKGDYKASQNVVPGDILIANTDLTQNREVIGSPIIMPDIGEEACFSLDLSKLVIKDEDRLDKQYLYYFLKSPIARDYMLANSNGSTVVHLSVKNVPKMRIVLPPLEVQKKIADILGTIDEKIELNRRMNETLEQMGQSLFRHYFIDNPEAENWQLGVLSDISEVLTGKGSARSQLSENGVVPLYGANGVMGVSEDYLYDEPLIITGRVGTLGEVRKVSGKAWFSDNVLIMRPASGYFGYVYNLAKSFDYTSMNRGSSQPLITQTDLRNRKVKLPDENTLSRFELQSADLFKQQQANDAQTQILTTLRDTLLPRLISGKVNI